MCRFIMLGAIFYLFAYIQTTESLQPPQNTFQTLLPGNKVYTYHLTTNVSTSVASESSYWILDGKLVVQTLDDFSRARFTLEELKTSVHSKHANSTEKHDEHVEFLKKPWEVDVCFSRLHIGTEPLWVTNVKRALSFNFLFTEPKSSYSTYHNDEPCLYGNCVVVYSHIGTKTRKYNSLIDYKRNRLSTYEQNCLPNGSSENWYRPSYSEDTTNIMTAERIYEVNEKGLQNLELKSSYQHRTHDNILSVTTTFNLHYESDKPAESVNKLNLSETHLQYVRHTYDNPSNGIWSHTQDELRSKTYDTLLFIAKKGIDTDNIVRNASLIHSLDFIEMLNTISQLNYDSLHRLFIDVLGTSYELETSRNIFLEMLPYVRTEACAKLIKSLVTEHKSKIEDSMLVSLIRKLPYNVLDLSKSLLEELEVFTKLGPEYSEEIRHAGILSFATLVHKTMEVSFDQQYFDDVYDKYLRMFNNCPQYLDRLIWLQGLTNIGKSVVNYLDEIHTDLKKDRHERFWAALASLSIWRGSTLENTLPILMNENEHIQLRILALHGFLSSPIGARDFLNVHHYIKNCNNDQLKRFWYTTVKNLVDNRYFYKYKSALYYIPFVINDLPNPGLRYWSTNNYMLGQEALISPGPTFQLLTVGDGGTGPPQVLMLQITTGGEHSFNAAVYIIAEGVTANVFKRLQNFNASVQAHAFDDIFEQLQNMKVQLVESEKVHIDVVIKINEKTVYATHINQERFDGWSIENVKKSIEDFVRFGSHINQQMVYYPIQIVKDFPTEIGTPIRFQSTIVSFTSIRGNLTAPSTEDLTWRNDLHIRYQATSVTSLSTDSPLRPSMHTARIQQSMVVHLPIKLDVSLSPAFRALELLWTNPTQSGGVAMHSRTQIGITTNETSDISSIIVKNVKENNAEGIFFDCEHPMSIPEVSTLLLSKTHNFLTTLQPSNLILSSLHLIPSPTSGSCGLILPPRQLETGNKIKLRIKLDQLIWDGDDIDDTEDVDHKEVRDGDSKTNSDRKVTRNEEIHTHTDDGKQRNSDTKIPKENLADIEDQDEGQGYKNGIKVKISYGSDYYRNTEENQTSEMYLLTKGYISLNSDGKNGGFIIKLSAEQPKLRGIGDWTLCLHENHKVVNAPFNIDFSSEPPIFDGHFYIAAGKGQNASCKDPQSKLMVKYKIRTKGNGRMLDADVWGDFIPILDLRDTRNVLSNSELAEFLKGLKLISAKETNPVKISVTETNGSTSIMVDTTEDLQEYNPDLTWLPGTKTVLQTLREIGFYHECKIQGSKVTMFSGKTIEVSSWFFDTLVVGECTENPRFAVTLSQPGGIFVTTGKNNEYHSGKPIIGTDIRLLTEDDATLIRSKLTGIYMYHRPNETIILMPQTYLSTSCGVCAGSVFSTKY